MSKMILSIVALALFTFLPAQGGFMTCTEHLGHLQLNVHAYSNENYPSRDILKDQQFCGPDYRTRYECKDEAGKLVLRKIKDNNCNDKQLCWPPGNFQGVSSTTCEEGTVPVGFAQVQWKCENDPNNKPTLAQQCDPSGQFRWQCDEGEWRALRPCPKCNNESKYTQDCDWDEYRKWKAWLPLKDQSKLQAACQGDQCKRLTKRTVKTE
ncbi:hypothetical protein P389DRAFT_190166 [Cystobasidium minutum MCA 4210]|uniref:uncharacterized protein n=1 Tax=Cystobasidium minutum MCA 4210 TaxID=1397322 RepID=UPI0034CEA3FF|eukprot:jgi/Rhomi1/190166/estExt_fgenesh1_pg.C_4_t20346